MCKCNTGQISFLKCIHKTSVKLSSVAIEFTGAPEDQAQLTIKYLRTQGIGTTFGESARTGLYGLGMLAIASTGPCCN